MNILILGATGRVGSELVKLFLAGHHHVKALVRTPGKMQVTDEHLTVIQGNVLHVEDISAAIQGSDIVLSALSTDRGTTLSECLPLIIDAMKSEGVTRIITIGTAGILQSRTEPHLLRYQSSESKRKTTRAAKEHHLVYDMLAASGLEWTIVCPTYLPLGTYTGTYRVERDFLPLEGSEISVYDTAAFAFKQVESSDFIRARVGISY